MIAKSYNYIAIIILVSIWWGWTVLVDFFIIPTVFQIIPQFFQAGELGIAVFSKLNNLEMIIASLVLGLSALSINDNKKNLFIFTLALCLWIISTVYFTYLTPKLIELTILWKEADVAGQMSVAGIADVQQAHQYFHRLYIMADTFKLILLSIMLVLTSLKKDVLA